MVYGVLGDLIEVLSILCTVFGVCTSLGLGAMQINKGLVRLDRGTYLGKDSIGCASASDQECAGRTGLQENTDVQICIIVGITLLATASVVAGLKKGIAALSNIAFALSLFILLCILFMDETWYILNALTSSFGYYLWYLPKISFHTDAWEELGSAADSMGGAPDDRGGKKGWMNNWTIFYWGWWISWAPFVGTFLARISKGRKLGHFIIATLILPTIWSFVFLGIFGAAQIRMVNLAKAAGLTCKQPYGSLVAGVDNRITHLYCLPTEDVLFEHLVSYGGHGWGNFMTVLTLICVILYFITSSDSASFVVDIMAANGIENPPLLQKVFWAFTEGAAASALLASSANSNDPKAALNAVKALPIILGLPFTFLLFWMCQGLLIVCKEEAQELSVDRKHFSVFLFNIEPISYLSILFPFVGTGQVAAKCWDKLGMAPGVWMALYGTLWFFMVVLFFLTAADTAFSSMGVAMYFMLAMATAGLRVATRNKLDISGDMISDVCACCFALPWAIGQMHYEFYPP